MIKRNTPVLPERQAMRAEFRVTEIRASAGATDGGLVDVTGVASVYGYQYDVYGGPGSGGWVEQVARGAFDQTLAENPDVVFLVNHDGLPLARTKSGTLALAAGDTGLEVRSQLDPRNTDAANLLNALERGDITEMSFAFRVTQQQWSIHPDFPGDEMGLRTITEVNLHRGDVSAVTYGASDATSIDVARSLRLADDAQLLEYQQLIAQRLALRSGTPDGMSEPQPETGGMPAHLLHLLRL